MKKRAIFFACLLLVSCAKCEEDEQPVDEEEEEYTEFCVDTLSTTIQVLRSWQRVSVLLDKIGLNDWLQSITKDDVKMLCRGDSEMHGILGAVLKKSGKIAFRFAMKLFKKKALKGEKWYSASSMAIGLVIGLVVGGAVATILCLFKLRSSKKSKGRKLRDNSKNTVETDKKKEIKSEKKSKGKSEGTESNKKAKKEYVSIDIDSFDEE